MRTGGEQGVKITWLSQLIVGFSFDKLQLLILTRQLDTALILYVRDGIAIDVIPSAIDTSRSR